MTSTTLPRSEVPGWAAMQALRRSPMVADALIPVLVALASGAAVFHRLDFSAWFDETFSHAMAVIPLDQFFTHWAWGTDANMVFYYLVLRLWLSFTGLFGLAPTEVVLRTPSALFAVGAAVMVYFIGRRLFGLLAGALAAVLYAINFLQLIVAQMARSYTLEVLLLCVSWYALIQAVSGRRPSRWWPVFVASSVLAIYSSLFTGLVLVAEAVALGVLWALPGAWRDRVRAGTRPALISFAIAALLVVPIGVDAAIHGGPVWVPPVNIHSIPGFLRFMSAGSRSYELAVLGLAAVGGLLALMAALPSRARQPAISRLNPEAFGGALAMLCWFAVPIVLSFALTLPQLNLHLFFSRYLVVVIPPLCLLVGLGVSALRWRLLQAVVALALLVVAWPVLLQYYPLAQSQNFKDPVLWIEQRYQPGDGLICDPSVQCGIPVEYYLQVYRGPARFDADSPGRFRWDGSGPISVDEAGVLRYAEQHRRVFFIFGPLGKTPELLEEGRALNAALAARYQPLDQTVSHAVAADSSVVLYQVRR